MTTSRTVASPGERSAPHSFAACGEPMTFLAQLDTDDRVGVQFGDDGRLYAFVCPRCVTVATLVQST